MGAQAPALVRFSTTGEVEFVRCPNYLLAPGNMSLTPLPNGAGVILADDEAYCTLRRYDKVGDLPTSPISIRV